MGMGGAATVRIDKYLTLQGLGTRNGVRALLRAGRVSVDGAPVADAGHQLSEETARVTLDGEALAYRDSMHIMLNKPSGYLTASRDARHKTVMELLPKAAWAMGCMPIGRLDIDTEGLLLFTTDGHLAYRLLAPKRLVEKEYIAHVDAPLGEADVAAFAEGMALSDFTALPAALRILPDGLSARVTVHEGKFHQIKRMFEACGKKVLRLTRVAFAGIPLDEALALGGWRELTAQELSMLYAAVGGASDA